jgi:fibro-slime domain-containing protein
MQSRVVTTVTCYGLLALAGGISFTLPDSLDVPSAAAQMAPDTLYLTGIVRDFSALHADFNASASAGFGHYAGSVGFTLVDGRRPYLQGVGYKVATEWTDASGQTIAPHFYNMFNPLGTCFEIPGIATGGAIIINNQCVVDSFNSTLGPYGGANVGSDALVSTNSITFGDLSNLNKSTINGSVYGGPGGDMNLIYNTQPNCQVTGSLNTLSSPVPLPPAMEPTWLGPSTGPLVSGAGTTVIKSDMHVDSWTVEPGAIVQIENDVTILCEGDVKLAGFGTKSASVEVNGTLTLYVKGNFAMSEAVINMKTGDPSKFRLFMLGGGNLTMDNVGTELVGRIYAPGSTMTVNQWAHVYGTFAGESIVLNQRAEFHVDTAYSGSMNFKPDLAGTQGPGSTGGVKSAATFDEWFRDVLGVNQSAAHTIEMTRNGFGVYQYLDNSFHPIDNLLLGNESEPNNNYFTYALRAEFTYDSCTNQFVRIEGGDGAWIFIDGKLVADLGGVVPVASQYFELDRLGLEDGQVYDLHLFYAQRHPFASIFRFWTNLELSTDNIVPSLTAVFD